MAYEDPRDSERMEDDDGEDKQKAHEIAQDAKEDEDPDQPYKYTDWASI